MKLGGVSVGVSAPSRQARAPVSLAAPVISGALAVGQVLTGTTGTWSPAGATLSRQWKSGSTNVGTNAATYTLAAGDVGALITCVVTATITGKSATRTSNSLGPVTA